MRVALVTIGVALAIGQAQAAAPLAAQGCVGCHGVNGTGSPAGAAIAGQPKDALLAAMRAFRANERPGTIMGRVTRGYTDAELDAVAEHFSTLK
jgi:sulfide dehydrogenase cytochrome subunit